MNYWTAIKDTRLRFQLNLMKQTRKTKSFAWLFCLLSPLSYFSFPIFFFFTKHTKGDLHPVSISYPYLMPQSFSLWCLISPWPPPTELKLLFSVTNDPMFTKWNGHFLPSLSNFILVTNSSSLKPSLLTFVICALMANRMSTQSCISQVHNGMHWLDE